MATLRSLSRLTLGFRPPLPKGLANAPPPASQRGYAQLGGSLQASQYGGLATVTVVPGDGVGPELMRHVEQVFRAALVPVEFEVVRVDSSAHDGKDIHSAIESIKRNRVGLKGNFETPVDQLPVHCRSLNVLFRNKLELFANVNRYCSLPGVVTRYSGIDVVIIRETTEGEYTHLEHESVPGVVESLKIITRERSIRVAEYAFDYARKQGRRSLSVVHKANIMKLADGLFLQCCREVSAGYPEIKFNDVIVDNATMQLVSRPGQFDVMLMPNLYGVVINNICAGLVGGPGLVPGASFSHKCAVFQTAIRNTALGLANKNVVNPTAMLLASCLMLDHLRLHDHATLIRDAVLKAVTEAKTQTRDIGGTACTTDVVNYIISQIQKRLEMPVQGL
ncbi:isocitrate dehydrogenase [NAD] subunit gamma, mitochondrial-like [Heterodontus francisci]|uniref:isocitrate dehydrogenase [NAD] subunit gamma, mitochondrial-like n=1 Tax=Heterodontus francisci TaxID=7792 RepID=UPI00355B371F